MGFVLFIVFIFIVCGLIQYFVGSPTSMKENGKHLAQRK